MKRIYHNIDTQGAPSATNANPFTVKKSFSNVQITCENQDLLSKVNYNKTKLYS